jgi:hypothetical protein
MKCIEKQLQRRQSLLAIDDGSFLHLASFLLQLLQNDSTQEVRVVFLKRFAEDPVRYADKVIPERVPLVLFIPDVRTLEERDH